MKRLLIAIAALIAIVGVSAAQWTGVYNPMLLQQPGAGCVTSTFASNATVGSTSSNTFSTQAISTASSTRYVVVGSIIRGAGITTTAMTIGGVAASSVVASAFADGNLSFWVANVPTGTTADIAVTYSGSTVVSGIGTWATYDLGSTAVFNSGSSTANPASINLNVPACGVGIGIGLELDNGPNATWTGLTEDFDAATSGGGRTYTGASKVFAAAQTPLAVTVTWGTFSTANVLAASWGP